MRYLRQLTDVGRGDLALAGGKGANLGELTRAGLPVPPGVVLTTDAYRAYVATTGIGERILAALPTRSGRTIRRPASAPCSPPRSRTRWPANCWPPARSWARPSRSARPPPPKTSTTRASPASRTRSWTSGATTRCWRPSAHCWASLWTARAIDYRARRGIDPAEIALAVVVQEMVDADAAGVMFTANATTGVRDEVVIAAAWGLGEAVVGGAVTTDDLVVEKATGRVRSRATAEKAVMTVATGAGTEERPVPDERRSRPVLTDAEAAALAALGTRIEEWFGAPQDVEWARAGGEFAIVQSRPITALPEPAAPPPDDWSVPDPTSFYVRASIVEQLPDPLTPLFAELVDGSVTRSLQALMGELLRGDDIIRDGDLALPTVNGYAYYRYSRSGMARMTRASGPAFSELVRGGGVGLRDRWRERAHPQYVRAVERAAARPVEGMTNTELLDGAVELLDAGTAYYTAVQTIIPQAVTSESAFTRYYERLVRRPGDPPAVTFLLGFDSAPIRAEQSLFDLAAWARTRPALADALRGASPQSTAAAIDADEPPAGVDAATWQEWCDRFEQHLALHGHTVYNLDFAVPVPADDPAPVIGTVRFYLDGGGTEPRERQRRAAQRRDEATAQVAARLDPVRRAAFLRLLRWAQSIAPLREDALADVGLAWPQLRRMLRELGARLVAAGAIERADDVFWLHRAEILAEPPGSARRRRGAAAGAVAGAAAGDTAAGAPAGQLVGEGVRPVAPGLGRRAGGPGAARDRGQRRAGHRHGPGARRPGRLRPAAARRRAGREHHHPGLDDAVRDGERGRHGRRRPAEPQLDRGPRVRHPGGAGHERRHPADPGRRAGPGGRRGRHGDPARRAGRRRHGQWRDSGAAAPRPPAPSTGRRVAVALALAGGAVAGAGWWRHRAGRR